MAEKPPPYPGNYSDVQKEKGDSAPFRFSIRLANNPTIPFWCPLPKLFNGYILIIRGNIPKNAHRFGIDFVKLDGDTSDVALHINPRFDENVVVRNSRENGNWQTEERSAKPSNPLTPGTTMELIVLADIDVFKIAFNGVHYCEFRHRLPMENISCLEISGDIDLQAVQLNLPVPEQSSSQASPPPYEECSLDIAPSCVSLDVNKPVYDLEVPYHAEINGGLCVGSTIIVVGKVPQGAKSFSVNLCYENHKKSNIAFHFNPRLYENQVVRNARTSILWGKEEREGGFPFSQGDCFILTILCETEKFEVCLDSKHFIDFKYRLKSLDKIRHLIIDADVMLSSVDILT